jgi:hypothetical protein
LDKQPLTAGFVGGEIYSGVTSALVTPDLNVVDFKVL